MQLLLLVGSGLGILLIVVLVYAVTGDQTASLPAGEVLQDKYAKEYGGGPLESLLVDTPGQMAIGWDPKESQVVLFYTHGMFVNIRVVKPVDMVRARLEDKRDKHELHIYTAAFDRDHFVLTFGLSTPEATQAEVWRTRCNTLEAV
jgi:hypothetical protein